MKDSVAKRAWKRERPVEKRRRTRQRQTIIETEKERTSKVREREEGVDRRGGREKERGREEKRRARQREARGREKDVTRGITWCIDRRAASTRAIPAANLPTYPKHYPFPSSATLRPTHFPPDHHSLLRPPSLSRSLFLLLSSTLHTCSCNKPTPSPLYPDFVPLLAISRRRNPVRHPSSCIQRVNY